MLRLAAASAMTPPACAVPIAVFGVLVGEHPLDRDDVGTVGVHPVLDGVADGQQPTMQGLVGRGADDVDVQRNDPPTRPPSMTDSPHRVNPGSTPITRTGRLLL